MGPLSLDFGAPGPVKHRHVNAIAGAAIVVDAGNQSGIVAPSALASTITGRGNARLDGFRLDLDH
jgi:hypothetical protein